MDTDENEGTYKSVISTRSRLMPLQLQPQDRRGGRGGKMSILGQTVIGSIRFQELESGSSGLKTGPG